MSEFKVINLDKGQEQLLEVSTQIFSAFCTQQGAANMQVAGTQAIKIAVELAEQLIHHVASRE